MSSSSSTNNAIANVEFPEKITSNFLKDIFDEQKKYVDYFFTNLDHSLVEQFTKIVLDCKGLIFLTGTSFVSERDKILIAWIFKTKFHVS